MSELLELTQASLKALLDYEPDSGVFTWRERRDRSPQWNGRYAGTMAGSIARVNPHHGSYRQIRIGGKSYYEHRLAWLWMTGSWPTEIDHRDRHGCNNRIDNLRVCTSSQNQGNRKAQSNNAGGLKGVRRRGSKFVAFISAEYLGTFETKEAAHAAYCQKAVEVFGEFARGK